MGSSSRPALEWYFQQSLPTSGRFDMVTIAKQTVRLAGLELIRFSNTTGEETQDQNATVHFFEADDKFDQVWNMPESSVAKLAQYRQMMSPDFSLWSDMPVTLQFLNTVRNRWCGAFWQSKGLTVIPTVSWSDGRSFDFCFSGIEQGSTVAVSTLGCQDRREDFMRGYRHMARAIQPEAVVCYAEPFAEMRELCPVVAVPYAPNTRIARRLAG
ncbi:MAG: DUF4417 domain-containing protein [Propionibacteriaceae bacterium]|jgi:hypothetical protein|nr:DUF4417 domain-containing protein [Propionibacteriaceae bacterium]